MDITRTNILCTLGPSSMNDWVIARLQDLGVDLFRVNLSHTRLEDLAGVIEFIQARTAVPICLDTEGAQVRTGTLPSGMTRLEENMTIVARAAGDGEDGQGLNFYPDWVLSTLEIGDLVSIDFNGALVQVTQASDRLVELRVLSAGDIGSNKAVTVHRDFAMPPLTDKDIEALKYGAAMGLRHIALSFAHRPEDVTLIREVFGREAFVISKIECRSGLANVAAIADRSDAVLIDRGDLSREVVIEQIPRLQKEIIGAAKVAERPVYVATNLLESMVTQTNPTRAEVNDVYNTLIDGADGLVLAAETAIGQHPVACASMIARLIKEFEVRSEPPLEEYPELPHTLLVEPHGGHLVHREASETDRADLDRHPTLAVSETDLMDCQQFAFGTYSPLTGFMTKSALESVLAEHRLPNGLTWTMPIVLQVPAAAARHLPERGRVVLTDANGTSRAFLDIEEIYTVELERIAENWFGTASTEHPGVARLFAGGSTLIGGDVTLIARQTTPFTEYELTPLQTRFVFSQKGWSRVVGFHTRNVAHRVHEHIQLTALHDTQADGLYINPVIGPKKSGDFLSAPVLASYRTLVGSDTYPAGKVILGGFATYARYSGPREAVFTALCRKNMGCSHFIIGRDHTGVGDFYPPDAIRKLFDQLGQLDIEPVFFPPIGYNAKRKSYEPLDGPDVIDPISGTEMRAALLAGEPIPSWFVRKEIQDFLRSELSQGRSVFSN